MEEEKAAAHALSAKKVILYCCCSSGRRPETNLKSIQMLGTCPDAAASSKSKDEEDSCANSSSF